MLVSSSLVELGGRMCMSFLVSILCGGLFGRGIDMDNRPSRKSKFFGPNQKLFFACHTSKKPLPLHSWRPFTNLLLSALHVQGPKSNIFVQFYWVNKQLIGISFSKWTANKTWSQKYYKTLICTEVIIFVTYHWKGLCHSKMKLKLVT
jgi:hypothetical protein